MRVSPACDRWIAIARRAASGRIRIPGPFYAFADFASADADISMVIDV